MSAGSLAYTNMYIVYTWIIRQNFLNRMFWIQFSFYIAKIFLHPHFKHFWQFLILRSNFLKYKIKEIFTDNILKMWSRIRLVFLLWLRTKICFPYGNMVIIFNMLFIYLSAINNIPKSIAASIILISWIN